MPIGLRNAAQSFQQFMDRVLRGLPFVYSYLDDILITSSTAKEHQDHLHQFFSCLENHGLHVHPSKCPVCNFTQLPGFSCGQPGNLPYGGQSTSHPGLSPATHSVSPHQVPHWAVPASRCQIRPCPRRHCWPSALCMATPTYSPA